MFFRWLRLLALGYGHIGMTKTRVYSIIFEKSLSQYPYISILECLLLFLFSIPPVIYFISRDYSKPFFFF